MTALTSIAGDRLTAAQIAEALKVSARAVQKRSSKEAWPHETEGVIGGRRKLFPVATLPADVQRQVILANPPASASEREKRAFTYSPASHWATFERKPVKQQAIGRQRAAILRAVMALVEHGTALKTAFELVGERYGERPRTLENWYHGKPGKPGAKHYARQDWPAALAPAYTGRTAKATCSPEAWEFFKATYLRLEQPTGAHCYELLKTAARDHGWEIPSLKTLERRIKQLPRALVVMQREGIIAANRLYPAQQRTVRDLHALEWINGDGYQHNVFVRWPDGSIARPKTWFWQDVYSRKLLAWRTDLTEHTDVIRLSFGDLVEKYGIPDHITIDNTRAAANKWMTGGVAYRNRYKTSGEDPLGLWPQLDIEVHWSSLDKNLGGKNVGHGQAKPVERMNQVVGEYVDKRLEFAGAYCGTNPQAKPENYGSKAIPLEAFLAGLEEGVKAINAREGRGTEVCAGKLSYAQAFAQSYETALIRRATEQQRRMWMLPAEARRVQKDGTFTLDAGSAPGAPRNRYWDEQLVDYAGHKIVARFDPDHLHDDVHVYALDGRYIGSAHCLQPVGYGDTQAGREHSRAHTQWRRALRDQAQAEIKIDALQAARLLPSTPAAPEPKTKLVRVFQPAVRAVGSDIEITQQDEDEMARNFARNVLKLADRDD